MIPMSATSAQALVSPHHYTAPLFVSVRRIVRTDQGVGVVSLGNVVGPPQLERRLVQVVGSLRSELRQAGQQRGHPRHQTAGYLQYCDWVE